MKYLITEVGAMVLLNYNFISTSVAAYNILCAKCQSLHNFHKTSHGIATR